MMQQQSAQDQAVSNQQQQQRQQQQIQQQQQQLVHQQQQQQMVLCPVRVVYETQVLVPPGEQIQANQTYFVNPQNQPPWATQNTTMFPQNQMMYVQQVQPNNIVPSVQPPIDQNQMYIQQTYPTMQQMIASQNQQAIANQNALIAQNMQDRQIRQPVQYANVQQNQIIGFNQYGQLVAMQSMPNIPQNVSNIVQTPNVAQNIQSQQIVQQINQQKPPETQQDFQFRQNMIQSVNIRPNVAPQQIQLARNVEQNAYNVQQNTTMHQMQIQPNITQNIQQPMPQNVATRVNVHTRQPVVHNVGQNSPNVVRQTNMPRQNVASPQMQPNQRNVVPNNFTLQQHLMKQTQPTPMETSNSYNQVPASNVITMPPQNHQNQNKPTAKIGIPNVMQSNAQTMTTPQIRPRPPPTPNIQMKVTPTPQARSMPILRPMVIPTNPLIQMQSMTPTMPSQPQQIRPGMTVTNYKRNVSNASTSTDNQNTRPFTNVDNRKRKSESPDEFKNKVTITATNQVASPINRMAPNSNLSNNNTMKKTNVSEIGVNTTPIFKPNPSIPPPSPAVITYPFQQGQSEIANTKTETAVNPTNITHEKEKMVRNTVFSQALTRKLSNTSPEKTENIEPVREEEIKASKIIREPLPMEVQTQIKNEVQTEPEGANNPIKEISQKVASVSTYTKTNDLVTKTATVESKDKLSESVNKSVVTATNDKTEENSLKTVTAGTNDKIKDLVQKRATVVKTEPNITVESVKVETPVVKKEKEPIHVKTESESMDEKIRNLSDKIGKKEIELSHGNINKRDGNANNYILTHVLDGIVIQESNVAFPIRLPLKEKILPNPPALISEVLKTEIAPKVKEPTLEENKTADSKIPNISELHLDGENEVKESVDNKTKPSEESPLLCSKPQAIKTWTAEELASHLSQEGWHETASIIREHEIDGEALGLVSSTQLVEIGIAENHATILCDLIKS